MFFGDSPNFSRKVRAASNREWRFPKVKYLGRFRAIMKAVAIIQSGMRGAGQGSGTRPWWQEQIARHAMGGSTPAVPGYKIRNGLRCVYGIWPKEPPLALGRGSWTDPKARQVHIQVERGARYGVGGPTRQPL